MGWATPLGAGLVAGGALWALMELRGWLAERRVLRGVLALALPGGRVRSRDDVLALWRLVGGRVRWEPARAFEDRRPLLRDPAGTTWARGEGLCGENARLSVRLLRLAGCRAHRLYLFGERWGHVVVELRWDGAWRLFDAHQDAVTLPSDEEVGVLTTEDLARFPNRQVGNRWVAAATVKALRGFPLMARRPPPGLVVEVMESPNLLRLTGALAVTGAGVAALLA